MTGPTVLVVDDHAGFRATARRLLERGGWTVVGEAADGASAVAAARALTPDLVLLDIGLPDIDGFAVAERLAKPGQHVTRPPAVVLISSRERDAFTARLDGSAAIGFVAKDELDASRLVTLLSAASRS